MKIKGGSILLGLCAAIFCVTAAPAAAATPILSPTSAVFPDTPFRTDSAPKTFTLTNPGPGTVQSNVGVLQTYDSGTFRQTNDCLDTMLAGTSCTITVIFAPYSLTPPEKSGTLNAGEGAATAALSGRGISASSTKKKKKCKKGKKRALIAKKKCKKK